MSILADIVLKAQIEPTSSENKDNRIGVLEKIRGESM